MVPEMKSSPLTHVWLSAVALLGAGCGAGQPELAPGVELSAPALERPNLLLISVDTLRADYLGCYGYPKDTSPAIDALAEGGTLFEDMQAASPWTLPSHASMLSGLYPSRHGVIDHNFSLTSPTLATLLKDAGYSTMAIVNVLNIGGEQFGLMRGYDLKHYEIEVPVITAADGSQHMGKMILNSGKAITRRANAWLDARDTSKPFFMFLHFYDVHTDLTPDPEWKQAFVGEYAGTFDGTTMPLFRVRNGKRSMDAADIQWLKEMYAAEIRTLDDVLGAFFQGLEDKGLEGSTVVALTSDHGEEFFEHGSVLHGRTYFEEQTRIPLILRGPGVPAGLRISERVHHIDIAPSLLAFAGVPAPPMDGVDLGLAWTTGSPLDRRELLFSEADHNNVVDGHDVSNIRRMLRQGPYKLIYDTVSGQKVLYNLELDPREQQDLALAEPERTARMFAALKDFMRGAVLGNEIGELDEAGRARMRALGYGGSDEDEDDDDE